MKPKMEVTFLLRHSITNSKDIYTSKSYCFRKWFARSERGIALPHHLLVTVTKTAMGFVKKFTYLSRLSHRIGTFIGNTYGYVECQHELHQLKKICENFVTVAIS